MRQLASLLLSCSPTDIVGYTALMGKVLKKLMLDKVGFPD
jgi:hypothetical protein